MEQSLWRFVSFSRSSLDQKLTRSLSRVSFPGLYEEVAHKVDWFEPLRDLVKEKLGVVDPVSFDFHSGASIPIADHPFSSFQTRKHQPRVTYISR